MKHDISTIIITRNEQQTIRRCLSSVAPFSSEIILVDSGSTDATVEIAREFTDKVYIKDWSGYILKKQFALSKTSETGSSGLMLMKR
jgi:glycosyltransferase involved in cell wall biosynthesis